MQRQDRRTIREIGADLERLQWRVAQLDRDLAADSYDASHETRGQLSFVSLGLQQAHGAIARAERGM
jgi:hypothetical protein